jgi:hypothetical protein
VIMEQGSKIASYHLPSSRPPEQASFGSEI